MISADRRWIDGRLLEMLEEFNAPTQRPRYEPGEMIEVSGPTHGLTGIAHAVQESDGGRIEDITRATYPWWRAQVNTNAGQGAITREMVETAAFEPVTFRGQSIIYDQHAVNNRVYWASTTVVDEIAPYEWPVWRNGIAYTSKEWAALKMPEGL